MVLLYVVYYTVNAFKVKLFFSYIYIYNYRYGYIYIYISFFRNILETQYREISTGLLLHRFSFPFLRRKHGKVESFIKF